VVTGSLLVLGLVVEELVSVSALGVWGPHVAACVLTLGAALTVRAGAARIPVRMLSGRIRILARTVSGHIRVRSCSTPLTCPDTVRIVSADGRPDVSGHIPGGGP
jgi:hypothetical protein